MSTNAQRNHKFRKFRKLVFIFLLGLIAVVIYLGVRQQGPWRVPEAAKVRKNPLSASPDSIDSIKPAYREHCAECHGESGKGDGTKAIRYRPRPTDFTDAAHLNAVSDGELFYKISEGRRPMPGFNGRLTEEQRWQLVLLIRTFAQPARTLGNQ